jgi:hypothetical protein
MRKIKIIGGIILFFCILFLAIIIYAAYKQNYTETTKRADKNQAKNITNAIGCLIYETENPSLSNLYDYTGKVQLSFTENNTESVKKLIVALQRRIYYQNKPYGPYLDNPQSTDSSSDIGFYSKAIYDSYAPRWNTQNGGNTVGYKIEIMKSEKISKVNEGKEKYKEIKEKMSKVVKCSTVTKEQDAVIVFH